MSEIGYFTVGEIRLRQEPAREARFEVVRHETEMKEIGLGTPEGRREIVHRHMTNEITSLDIAAQALVDFPDAPWELRLELARQCWDEARHVRVLTRRFLEMHGTIGEFPISALEWCVTSAIDNLPGRLASQNRTLEAGAMDVVGGLIRSVREIGDEETAYVLDGILADEVHHVRFANRWIKRFAAQNPRTLMQVASAVRFLAASNAALQAREGEIDRAGNVFRAPTDRVPAVNIGDRMLAEFTESEVNEVLRQAGFRSLIPEDSASKTV